MLSLVDEILQIPLEHILSYTPTRDLFSVAITCQLLEKAVDREWVRRDKQFQAENVASKLGPSAKDRVLRLEQAAGFCAYTEWQHYLHYELKDCIFEEDCKELPYLFRKISKFKKECLSFEFFVRISKRFYNPDGSADHALLWQGFAPYLTDNNDRGRLVDLVMEDSCALNLKLDNTQLHQRWPEIHMLMSDFQTFHDEINDLQENIVISVVAIDDHGALNLILSTVGSFDTSGRDVVKNLWFWEMETRGTEHHYHNSLSVGSKLMIKNSQLSGIYITWDRLGECDYCVSRFAEEDEIYDDDLDEQGDRFVIKTQWKEKARPQRRHFGPTRWRGKWGGLGLHRPRIQR